MHYLDVDTLSPLPASAGRWYPTPPASAEAQIVARFLDGDEGAFEELVHRYEAAVRKLAFGFVRDYALAEDIAQDTFVRAYCKASSLRQGGSVRSWLFRIAINRAQDELRRIKRKREVSWETFDVPPVASDQPSAETRAASGELARNLAKALSEIRPEHRIPLVLREVEGLTYVEIAKLLGWPLGTVQARLHRGRLELRARLSELQEMRTAGRDRFRTHLPSPRAATPS